MPIPPDRTETEYAMARKDKKPREEQRAAADYYRLHSRAVDDLIHANEENSPEVSAEELKKYRSHRGISLPDTVKALLVKLWFNGAVCFFFFWGLGGYLKDFLDQLVVIALAMGVVTDLLVNNALRFLAKTPGENDRWMMFPKKGYASFPLNIVYAFVLLVCVVYFYQLVNALIIAVSGAAADAVPLGVEPVLFGLFYLGFDLLFLSGKHLLRRILDDAKQKTDRKE